MVRVRVRLVLDIVRIPKANRNMFLKLVVYVTLATCTRGCWVIFAFALFRCAFDFGFRARPLCRLDRERAGLLKVKS